MLSNVGQHVQSINFHTKNLLGQENYRHMDSDLLMRFMFLSLIFLSNVVGMNVRFASGFQPATGSRPNLLFIYVEDLGYYTSERFSREPNTRLTGLHTPNLDKLASQSIVFTHAFCGQSVCSPSKGAIYSGLAPHANGIWRNVFNNAEPGRRNPKEWIPLPSPLTPQNDPSNLGVGGLHEDIPSLIQKLKAGGVYCALSGKLHVQPALSKAQASKRAEPLQPPSRKWISIQRFSKRLD